MTCQEPDILVFGGVRFSMDDTLMVGHPALDRLPPREVACSGLWRGHVATWRVEERQLWLDEIAVMTNDRSDWEDNPLGLRAVPLETLFVGHAGGPIPAVWINAAATVRLHDGDGWKSLELSFEQGRLVAAAEKARWPNDPDEGEEAPPRRAWYTVRADMTGAPPPSTDDTAFGVRFVRERLARQRTMAALEAVWDAVFPRSLANGRTSLRALRRRKEAEQGVGTTTQFGVTDVLLDARAATLLVSQDGIVSVTPVAVSLPTGA